MEILNKNKRRKALWRLAGLWVLILACITIFLYATQVNYSNQGVSDWELEIEELRISLEKERGNNQGLRNEKSKLENDILMLKQELKTKDEHVTRINNELRECKEDLRAEKVRSALSPREG